MTKLRKVYTRLRNQASTERRASNRQPNLELWAKKAAKKYHSSLRIQKKLHWTTFLGDHKNIWEASKYLRSDLNSSFTKIPALQKTDGVTTTTPMEQASLFLKNFFPPLPHITPDVSEKASENHLPFCNLTMQEVDIPVLETNLWKAPGNSGLPSVIWNKLWSVISPHILSLFQTSLDEGILPSQWKEAKIIPVRMPGKPIGDYTLPSAYRPISLLCTLGKGLKSVIANRISYMVEENGILPSNHFGAGKRRSAVHALVILQEQIWNAWRAKKILSLVSFDIKGAYNGVSKERLIEQLASRRIPPKLIRWIDNFCSERTVNITVNGNSSKLVSLPQAGLPQGSPLSSILFLFFNATLIQQLINAKGGSLAFVDDYTAWVVGDSAEVNTRQLQEKHCP